MKARLQPVVRFLCVIISFCFLLALFPLQALAAQSRQLRVLRVGYPIQRGLTMKDESGKLTGYTYDYLMEISQYTGWKYEFVFAEGSLNEQITTLMQQLETGEIDLLGSMYYDASLTEQYAYPGYCYGINYSGLFVEENSALRETSLYNITDIKVGVYHRLGKQNEKLEQFAQMNNLNIEQVIVQSPDAFSSLLQDGRVDALLSTDLAMAEKTGMYPLVHFSPMPFYFATTSGKTDIVQQLDYALSTIDRVNPNFTVQLYNQYFLRAEPSVVLNEEEKNFIREKGTLEVALYNNKPPFQYVDSKTGEPASIVVEILDQIAKTTGFTFHYNMVSTYEDYLSLVASEQVEIAADALINYQDALDTNTSLTLPWGTLPVTLVTQSGKSLSGEGRVAVPYKMKNVSLPTDNVLYCENVQDCLDAVQSGTADCAYVDEYSALFYFNMQNYSGLQKLHQSTISTQNLCFGIYNAENFHLLSIFNKCISALPQDTVNEIMYRNAYRQQPMTFFSYIKQNFAVFLGVFFAVMMVILAVIVRIENREQKRIAFENKRYAAISNLVNEYFYEYDMRADLLTLSEKCAEWLSCESHITKFSRKLAQKTPEQIVGIWQLAEYIIDDSEASYEISCQMPDGTRQWLSLVSSVVSNKKKQVYAVGKIASIQEMKAREIRLEQQATLDGLTGIYNIATVKGIIISALERFETCQPCALLIMDIDNFKQVNDTYGHHNGDAVLVQAAAMITEIFPDEPAGRLGGDEFVVFAANIRPEVMEERCAKLCHAMSKKTHEMFGTTFSWSIGVAWARHGQSYENLYREADAALYQTKSASKNGYTVYREESQV